MTMASVSQRIAFSRWMVTANTKSNKLCRRPPQYTPAPCNLPLTFWPWKWYPSHVWRGLPLQGCKDHALAPLLYLQPTFDDNKFHQLRRSNVPSFENCHVVANKFRASSRLSRDLNPNVTLSLSSCLLDGNLSFPTKSCYPWSKSLPEPTISQSLIPTSSYVPGSCSIRFSSSRRPEKSTTLMGLSLTVYELWPFEIWAQIPLKCQVASVSWVLICLFIISSWNGFVYNAATAP